MGANKVGEDRDMTEGVAMDTRTQYGILVSRWISRVDTDTTVPHEIDPLAQPLESAVPTEDGAYEEEGSNTREAMARAKFIPCNHCAKFSGCRPRGLCNRCYYSPEIRAQYRKDEDWIERRKREAKEEQGRTQDRVTACHTYASSPTPYQPGTEGKLRAMIERAHLKIPLFNSLDGRKNIG